MKTESDIHVIFGAGPAGTTLAHLLHSQGKQVRVINRSGKADLPKGITVAAGDILDMAQVHALCAGATTIYHCANVPYPQQLEIIPRFGANILEGAAYANARLVVLDTLYGYGATHGVPMTEATPFAPISRKGHMRAELAQRYLAAHEAGKVQVTLGRAADFFGPRVLNSAMGDRVFPLALKNQPIQLLGNLDLPHSYGYIDDVARGLATLGTEAVAMGKAWLLPVVPSPLTQREMATLIGTTLRRSVRIQRLPKIVIQALGLFDANMREFTEMFYQYTEPQIVVSTLFEQTFGYGATPLDSGIRATVEWYQQQAATVTA